jgi:glutaredoxin-like protein NrdH
MAVQHVSGKDKGKIMLFALSTCVWCKKTKALLDELGVAYDYEYVDLLYGADRDKTMNEVKKWNPSCSFPTVVIKGKCIVGFKDNEIREALKP